jgi:hypothetical protein
VSLTIKVKEIVMPRELIEPLEDDKGTSGAAKRGNSTSRQVDVRYRYQPAGARKPKPSSRRARVTAATGDDSLAGALSRKPVSSRP